jgi:hypothetical protein
MAFFLAGWAKVFPVLEVLVLEPAAAFFVVPTELACAIGHTQKTKPAARTAAGMTDVLRTEGIIPGVRRGRQAEKASRVRYLC